MFHGPTGPTQLLRTPSEKSLYLISVTQNLSHVPAFEGQELAGETLPWCLCAQATGETLCSATRPIWMDTRAL